MSQLAKPKHWISHPKVKLIFGMIIVGILLGICTHAFADGTDVLAGTTGDATATIQNTGKKWLYLIEGITALGAYIKTKNIFVLGGVAVIAIFLNIVLKLAGS